jgi:hypothetical protein
MNNATSKGRLVEVMDMFGFKGEKKPRMAWVTWRIGDGERRAVAVREIGSPVPPDGAEPVERNPLLFPSA